MEIINTHLKFTGKQRLVTKNNGYNTDIINRIVNKETRKKGYYLSIQLVTQNNDNKKWISLPYFGTISETIGEQMNKHNIKKCYKAYTNLKKIIGTPKNESNKLEQVE